MNAPLAVTIFDRLEFRPQRFFRGVLVLLGSILIAISAQITLSVPFTPVPISGQTLGVLLVGVALGPIFGAMSVIVYLLAGLIGLPVFAGGQAGLSHLIGSTGGYLIGFIPAAYLAGWFAQQGYDRERVGMVKTLFLSNLVIYVFGIPWLASFVGWESALIAGAAPFILGDLIKITLAALLFPFAWKWVGSL